MKNNKTFRYVLKKGEYCSKKYITVHMSKDINKHNKHYNHLGICVSKTNGNSVKRNKLKRWVREAYKVEELDLKHGYNIIVLIKKNVKVEDLNYFAVLDELKICFRRLNLYEKSC